MPDYGHDLETGVFLTPSNASPHAPVQLAREAEELGFDLATFQDHPYQPQFHDTWTLLTWVAASTSRIRLAGNVLNVPLRQPAVLARSAASLDLLSGGRVDLGLGAGGFWDAIEAMGEPRRTPGQGVTALSEAIDIIRGIWAADDRSPLRVAGQFHHVDGAKRGPRPAHPIPIVVGAYKPRMLRLVGRQADGWLPSLGYLGEDGLAPGNATIDAAAREAGRDPREIRRLLNIQGAFSARTTGPLQGPPERWVEDLLALALEDGVGTFIVATDDPTTMTTFAQEVVPDLRERIAAERRVRGTTTGPVLSPRAASLRRDGIDYDGLPTSLVGSAVEPGSFTYPQHRATYMRGGRPGLVLRPGTTAEVVEALAFAREQPVLGQVPLSIRSGGHGISGRSTNDGGIVLDVGRLDTIEVLDAERRLVRVGPGARWGAVAAALDSHGWAISSGDYGGVAVGGLATAGGVGLLGREHGLTIDAVRAAEIVLADGRALRVSDTEHPEIFWALRGAGANLGVVTALELEAAEVGDVGWVQLAFDASDVADFLTGFGAAIEASPRDVTLFLVMGAPQRDGRVVAQVYGVVDHSDPDTVIERLQPFAALAPLIGQQVQMARYAQVMGGASDAAHAAVGEPHSRSTLVEHLTPELARDVEALLRSGATHFFSVRAVGGAISDVAADATAYAGRSANFSVTALGGHEAALDAGWAAVLAHGEGTYLSFDTGPAADVVARAFPPATLERLRSVKREVDPGNLFRDNAWVMAGS
ncbi:LLM class flavin-dependent oxidoreductase [Serinibacter arcticus]|uniref:Luciferase-like protein n=1 Tax=Serinibacter arcticus TaxID=1655435 RepID=A0A4Z1E6W1_9MICO|nr:LLM class flavin-dependent oxidoreductase [Serinibacter arcticus]TGO06598.1 luciferase-like protein [Serinibacter arcticus]